MSVEQFAIYVSWTVAVALVIAALVPGPHHRLPGRRRRAGRP